jgi:hypothetical protein
MANCCTLSNSQGDACPSILDIAKRLIIVPEVDASGAKNELANEAAVTKSALQAKFDAADKDDRYFPISILENVEDLRAEPTFFEFNSGRKAKIKEGTRTFTGFIPFQGPEYLGKLEEWACSKFGVYVIDKSGNFIYSTDASTKVKVQPIMVDQESFSAELVKKTDTDPIMIKITFDFRETEKDSLLRAIDASDLDFEGLSSADVYGLYDAKHVATSATVNGFTSTITENIYGFGIEGIVSGEFSIYNNTTSSDVPFTMSAVDNVYTFTFTSPQTIADVVKLSVSKAGYDDALIEAELVTIS